MDWEEVISALIIGFIVGGGLPIGLAIYFKAPTPEIICKEINWQSPTCEQIKQQKLKEVGL